MPASPGLVPTTTYTANLTPPAFAPGPSPIAALPLASLPAAGSLQPGTSAFISDATVAYIASNIGSLAVGGGANLARVFSTAAGWVIG